MSHAWGRHLSNSRNCEEFGHQQNWTVLSSTCTLHHNQIVCTENKLILTVTWFEVYATAKQANIVNNKAYITVQVATEIFEEIILSAINHLQIWSWYIRTWIFEMLVTARMLRKCSNHVYQLLLLTNNCHIQVHM